MIEKKYRYRCACPQPASIANTTVDGYKATCLKCHQSWPSNLWEIEDVEHKLRIAIEALEINKNCDHEQRKCGACKGVANEALEKIKL